MNIPRSEVGSRFHANVSHLFEVYCEIHRSVLGKDCTRKNTPTKLGIISETYPSDYRDDKTLRLIQMFAFPCDFDNECVLMYSFVVTSEDSKWRFGFCRHNAETDSVTVILSLLPWHETFFQMLHICADLKARNAADFNTFIANCYKVQIPCPGYHHKVLYQCDRKGFVIANASLNKLPSIPENYNLTVLSVFASSQTIIDIFSSLLHERRVIVTSSHLDRHSACVQAVNELLYPLQWQHTYIPVLPADLCAYIAAPMPYLIGAHSSVMDLICCEDIEDAVIFNCDTRTYENNCEDTEDLPDPILKELKAELGNERYGEHISRCFLLVMVRLLGSYRDGIEYRNTEPVFNDEKFLAARSPKKRAFLRCFLKTSMCMHFINTRMCAFKNRQVLWDKFECAAAMRKQQKRGKRCCKRKDKSIKPTNEIAQPMMQLQNQLEIAQTLNAYINTNLEDIRKSSEYKNAKTHSDMRYLFSKLSYLLAVGRAAFQWQQANCQETMRLMGYIEICSANQEDAEPCTSKPDRCDNLAKCIGTRQSITRSYKTANEL